jgi:hypothetical protein
VGDEGDEAGIDLRQGVYRRLHELQVLWHEDGEHAG